WSPATSLTVTSGLATTATPDTTTTYAVVASFPGCPDSIQKITITVEPVPTVYAGPDQTVCFGDTFRMQPAVMPTWYNSFSYSWTPAGAFDQPSTLQPIFQALANTTATLTVTSPAGCTANDAVEITVVPADFITVSADTGICPRDSAQLRAANGISYIWRPAFYIDDSTSATPFVSPVTTTNYTVYAMNAQGCSDTQTIQVTVHPAAVITLADSARIFGGERYQISPATNAVYFSWFPPLGLTETDISNPVASPDVNTRYFVRATTEYGCAVTDSIDLLVNLDSYLDVPNAFTPGSAPNNTIRVVRRGEAVLKSFAIYNRWGNKVFETSDINAGWDGSFKGKPQPMGVYVYVAEAVTPSGRKFTKRGNITLLR
ncbi:MAG: gliding motility-associated C-terminal domain-containing protein, partial [Sphingobacteriales bacterium]